MKRLNKTESPIFVFCVSFVSKGNFIEFKGWYLSFLGCHYENIPIQIHWKIQKFSEKKFW